MLRPELEVHHRALKAVDSRFQILTLAPGRLDRRWALSAIVKNKIVELFHQTWTGGERARDNSRATGGF